MNKSFNRLPAAAPHDFGGSWLERSRPLKFRLNGRQIEGFAGDTVLSAVLASGVTNFGSMSRGAVAFDERYSPPIVQQRRGNYLGPLPMDRTPAMDGMELLLGGVRQGRPSPDGLAQRLGRLFSRRTMPGQGHADRPAGPPWQNLESSEVLTAGTLVIGAGVAGMTAALTAAAAGESVILVERDQAVGGVARFFGAVDKEETPHAAIERLSGAVAAEERITTLLRTEIFRLEGGVARAHQVLVDQGEVVGRVVSITASRVVVATGAFERLPVFPGNRLPGVVGSLHAFLRAERHGVWVGKRVVFNTPHSFAYRLALHAADAGVEVQRVIDARVGPTSRFVDFCKASGITIASGLIASRAVPAGPRNSALSVSFAVAIDGISQNGTSLETDQLVAAGGWQPDIALWLLAGGAARWDGMNRWLAPHGTVTGTVTAGAAAGYRSNAACGASGKSAMLRLLGQPAPEVEERLIAAIYETPDASTPISPDREAMQQSAFLDRGWSFANRGTIATGIAFSGQERALGVGDVAAAVEIGAIPAADAGAVAAERCVAGGEILDTGWRLPPATPDSGIPSVPTYLVGRFGGRRQLCVLAVEDARFFEPGCPVYLNSDLTDPRDAIGVIVAAAPGGRSGGLALLQSAPEAIGATLFVRDTSGPVPVKVMERLQAPGK